MSKRKPEWNKYKELTSKKRNGNVKIDDPSDDYITVQRLSSNVEGRCQKYSRIGPLTMVSIGQDRTLESIKQACKEHFKSDLDCDVLAGERGPSYTDASQIKNWKVVHVRFVEREVEYTKARDTIPQTTTQVTPPTSEAAKSVQIHVRPPQNRAKVSTVAASVPLSEMLNLGKLIVPKVEVMTLSLEEFCISRREWLPPVEVKLSVDKEPFASGGFRNAFVANVLNGISRGKYVLKKYRADKIDDIENLFQSTIDHTRKLVQMNALARNFAQNMDLEKPMIEFGESFKYTKVYYACLGGEPVTLEEFIAGETFEKYVLNDGSICGEEVSDVSLKAECFVHYTYVRSDKQLMVVDIQGVKYSLCDPEVASCDLREDDKDDSSPILFCSGNLSYGAIHRFQIEHKCNKFCRMLNLEGV